MINDHIDLGELLVTCTTCEEPIPMSMAVDWEGERFCPECAKHIGLTICSWCGVALPQASARRRGKERYHVKCYEKAYEVKP
jgi:formylmethanofuran dehydrogenase subunit E